jgi:hypothetical protein
MATPKYRQLRLSRKFWRSRATMQSAQRDDEEPDNRI